MLRQTLIGINMKEEFSNMNKKERELIFLSYYHMNFSTWSVIQLIGLKQSKRPTKLSLNHKNLHRCINGSYPMLKILRLCKNKNNSEIYIF